MARWRRGPRALRVTQVSAAVAIITLLWGAGYGRTIIANQAVSATDDSRYWLLLGVSAAAWLATCLSFAAHRIMHNGAHAGRILAGAFALSVAPVAAFGVLLTLYLPPLDEWTVLTVGSLGLVTLAAVAGGITLMVRADPASA